jgi:hypothetical protein
MLKTQIYNPKINDISRQQTVIPNKSIEGHPARPFELWFEGDYAE